MLTATCDRQVYSHAYYKFVSFNMFLKFVNIFFITKYLLVTNFTAHAGRGCRLPKFGKTKLLGKP